MLISPPMGQWGWDIPVQPLESRGAEPDGGQKAMSAWRTGARHWTQGGEMTQKSQQREMTQNRTTLNMECIGIM